MKKSFLFLLSMTGLAAPLAAAPVSTVPAPGQMSYTYEGCCEPRFDHCCRPSCCEDECCSWLHSGDRPWGGFYIGYVAGYGWGEKSTVDSTDLKPMGWLSGGEIGWNYQRCNWVVGIEADLLAADISDEQTSLHGFAGTIREHTRFVGTVRARLGYDWCDNLLYVTGGFAYGGTHYDDGSSVSTSITRTRGGWAVGAGVERILWCNWSVKLEYLFYDLGKYKDTVSGASFKTAANTVRLGINYHF